MTDFLHFTSPEPLKVTIPENSDPVWFEHSESVIDIAAWALDNAPNFVQTKFQDRVLEIYELIKKYSEEQNRQFDYMMCAKELGLPGDIVYMECAPYILIDPMIDFDSMEGMDRKFHSRHVFVPYGDEPSVITYSIPDRMLVKYHDLDLNEHQMELTGDTVFRFIMCFEYMSGFVIYKDLMEREAQKKPVEEPKPKGWLSFFKKAA